MKKRLISAMTAVIMTASVNAATVGPIDEQVSGEAATAASINASFQALITAVNDNAAQIAELKSNDVDLVGKTFSIQVLGISLSAVKPGTDPEALIDFSDGRRGGRITTDIQYTSGTITFDDATRLTLGLIDQEITMVGQSGGSDIGTFPGDSVGPVPEEFASGTYVKSGNSLTATIDQGDGDFEVKFVVGQGGLTIQGFQPMELDADTQCFAQTDSTVDLQSDGTNDAYCNVEYESSFITGVAVQPAL